MDLLDLVVLAVSGGIVGFSASTLVEDEHPKTAAALALSWIACLFFVIF